MIIPITLTLDHGICAHQEVEKVSFNSIGITEAKIEEFLRTNIGLLFEEDDDETLLIVGQQVINLQNARNDLVALDANGNLVLIEIKRDASDMASRIEAMEFQAIRYAASLATVTTVDDLVERIFARYIKKWPNEFELGDLTPEELGKRIINKFLHENNSDKSFNSSQRIILVSSSFDEQTLSAAAWMNNNGIDISCISLNPIKIPDGQGSSIFLSVDKLIPARPVEDFFVGFPDVAVGKVSGLSSIVPGSVRTKTSLPRMAKLMEWGIVKSGDKLTIKGFADSEATVRDAKTVDYKGEVMSFNAWGLKVTGWSSVGIYEWAVNSEGRTLAECRAERMQQEATVSTPVG
jgi:hypothetical protein